MTPRRWNRYLSLPPDVQKQTDPRKYAAGQGIVQQRREQMVNAVVANYYRQLGRLIREKTVRRGASQMTARQLRWAAQASATELVGRASRKPQEGERNPFWYR